MVHQVGGIRGTIWTSIELLHGHMTVLRPRRDDQAGLEVNETERIRIRCPERLESAVSLGLGVNGDFVDSERGSLMYLGT